MFHGKTSENPMTTTDLRLQAVQELVDGLLIMDQYGAIVDANPAMCRMLGYTHAEMIDRSFSTMIAPQDALTVENLVEQFEQRQRVSLEIVKRDGATVVKELSGTRFTRQGQLCILASIRDITEQVATFEQLYRKEQERRQIAEGLRDILDKLNSSLQLGEVLDHIMTEPERLLKAVAAAIFKLDTGQRQLTVEAARVVRACFCDQIRLSYHRFFLILVSRSVLSCIDNDGPP